MSYLIDGYNLLHAMGLLAGRVGTHGLRKARLGLLGLLRGTYGDEASAVTVVFDAADARPGASGEEDYQGIQVRYAIAEEQADDLIESLIRLDSAPRQLTVVSDDRRIQRAAARRRCTVLGCDAYLDSLARRRRERRRPTPQTLAKPDGLSEVDRQHWLREFADLQNDPRLKELSDPQEFLDV